MGAHNQFMQPKDLLKEIVIGEEWEKRILLKVLKNRTIGTFFLAVYLIKKLSIKRSITTGEQEFNIIQTKIEIQRILKEHTTSKIKSETISKIKDMVF